MKLSWLLHFIHLFSGKKIIKCFNNNGQRNQQARLSADQFQSGAGYLLSIRTIAGAACGQNTTDRVISYSEFVGPQIIYTRKYIFWIEGEIMAGAESKTTSITILCVSSIFSDQMIVGDTLSTQHTFLIY